MSRVADNSGWTLPELVVVIAVLAIVAAVAAPRSFDRDVFAARAYAVELASAARLARAVAVASRCPVRLQISNAGYQGRQPATVGTHCATAAGGFVGLVPRADGSPLRGVAPSGLPFMGNLQWTFHGNGSVQLTGGNVAVVASHQVTVDPATGAIAGP